MRRVLFNVHWLLGISAGLVLAVVGVTGSMLSFEKQIITSLNDGIYLQARRGVDRNDARAIAAEAQVGKTFFREVRKLHRWLMVGEAGDRDVGRQIVGACTLALLFMATTGLYLRWPRGNQTWGTVLVPRLSLRGRALLWNLHSTLGLWCLWIYLLIALTGLTWSYPSYRDLLMSWWGPDARKMSLPLHSGQFFGLPGLVIFMLASLCMPLFAVTGWILYVKRRGTRRATPREIEAIATD